MSNFKWTCKKQGCYVKEALPRYDSINHLFPGDVKMSDIDGIVELDGHFLFVEVKPLAKIKEGIKEGQRILLDRLSRQPNTISLILWLEDTTDMRTVKVGQVFSKGQVFRKQAFDFDGLTDFLNRWVNMSKTFPVRGYLTAPTIENRTFTGAPPYKAPEVQKGTGRTTYDYTKRG